jgi:hypothetical protein
MGYCSDVMFAFYPARETETSEIAAWIEQHWPKAWCSIFEYDDRPIVTVKYNSVKWYDDAGYVLIALATVQDFETAFDANGNNARAHWEMVRAGEDATDIEQTGSLGREYRIGVRVEIQVY